MAMNDEETVALIAVVALVVHGAADPEVCRDLNLQQELKKGLGWKNSFVLEREDTISSGLEGA
jgi:catalase (peroxidase I)